MFKKGLAWIIVLLSVFATLAPFAGDHVVIFDHLSHVRPWIFAGSALAVLTTRLLVKNSLVTLSLIMVLVNGVQISGWFFDAIKPNAAGAFTVMQVNVYVGNDNYNEVIQVIRDANAVVISVQEADQQWLQELEVLKDEFPYWQVVKHESPFGSVLMSYHPIEISTEFHLGHFEIPFQKSTVQTPWGYLDFYAVHAFPPISTGKFSLRNEQLEDLADTLSPRTEDWILLGDLNTSEWSNSFKRFIDQANGRVLSRNFEGTWKHPSGLNLPIDHVIGSSNMCRYSCEVIPIVGSDHNAVKVIVGWCE